MSIFNFILNYFNSNIDFFGITMTGILFSFMLNDFLFGMSSTLKITLAAYLQDDISISENTANASQQISDLNFFYNC